MIQECESLFHEVATMFPSDGRRGISASCERIFNNMDFKNRFGDTRAKSLMVFTAIVRAGYLGSSPRIASGMVLGLWWTFVVSRNLHRRHMTSTQKAVLALEIEHQLGIEARRNRC